jgi:PKD repeat protein
VDCDPVFDTTFAWTPATPYVGQVITLSASVGGGTEPVTYSWDLGDGSSDSGMIITHVYGAAGTYAVTLTAENLCGADQDVQWIEVEELPPSHYLVYLPIITRRYTADFCGEALKNRDFERGHSFWTEESAGRPHLISNAWPDPYQGSWVAWLGGYDNAQDLLSQRIYVPAEVENDQHLTFYLYVDSNDDPGTPYDLLVVRFVDDWGNPLSNDIPIADNTTPMGWTRQSIDLVGFSGIGGMHVWIQFEATSNASFSTNFVIDLVSMDLNCHPPPRSGR